MVLEDLLHVEHYAEDDLVLFRCTECGIIKMSLGELHGHCEKHRGYTRFNIPVPLTKEAPANVDELMKLTEVLRVTDTEKTTLEEVDTL